MVTRHEAVPAPHAWDETADVVVVGAGMAGFCAALELAEAGADVMLLEKQSEVGGSSVLSGGSFAFAGTDLQRRMGIEDSSELLFEDLRRVGGYDNDEDVVRAYADNQLATYHWFAEHGVTYDKLFLAAGQSVPRSHSRNPREVLDRIGQAATATGRLRLTLSAAVKRLLRPAIGDRLEGVLAYVSGTQRRIAARLGVLLASGGFSRNDQLLQTFAPAQVATQRAGGAGNVGDGLRMAWGLGAGMRDMGHIKGTFGGYPSAKPGEHSIMLPIYVGAIAVNAKGQRFIDESKSYKLIGDAVLQQPDAIGYQIFDQKIFDRGQRGIPTMDFAAKLERGQVVKADSLRALARALAIDAAGLLRTVAEYNADVDSGADSRFGRDGLSNHYGDLAKIASPPFYGYASTSMMLATYCGVAVDAKMRVRDAFDEVIPGLCAAGEVVGGLHGGAYMTGSAIGKAAIFGRIAARTMLETDAARSAVYPRV
jgi:flavocytochrome c